MHEHERRTARAEVVVNVGFDGTAAWLQGPRGIRDLGGAQLAQAARDADFYGELHLRAIPGYDGRGT